MPTTEHSCEFVIEQAGQHHMNMQWQRKDFCMQWSATKPLKPKEYCQIYHLSYKYVSCLLQHLK